MKRLPREYVESTLNRMYKKLSLEEETIQLLHDYFDAFANFYEVLQLKDAFWIVDKQNKGLISREQFFDFCEIARHEPHDYYILGDDELNKATEPCPAEKRKIIHDSLLIDDSEDYNDMVSNQRGKPLYVPAKENLLKYSDEMYYEKTEYTKRLFDFLHNKLHIGLRRCDDIVFDCITIICISEDAADSLFDYFEQNGLNLTERSVDLLIPIITELCNNTRLPCNRGFTPCELVKQFGSGELNHKNI